MVKKSKGFNKTSTHTNYKLLLNTSSLSLVSRHPIASIQPLSLLCCLLSLSTSLSAHRSPLSFSARRSNRFFLFVPFLSNRSSFCSSPLSFSQSFLMYCIVLYFIILDVLYCTVPRYIVRYSTILFCVLF